MTEVSTRTNDEWNTLIGAKIAEILNNSSAIESRFRPLASISSPADPRFPRSIDHTLLKPDATPEQIDLLCKEALKYGFKSCCVNSVYIPRVSKSLGDSASIPCCVIGFPLGANLSSVKAFEAREAVSAGAREIDMVIPIGLLKSKQYTAVFDHIKCVVESSSSMPVKVILETFLLTREEIIAGSFLSAEAGAAFVKTCTGFSGGAAKVDDVELMSRTVSYKGGLVKVKASAGVRNFDTCVEMFKAGAERIGTSSGVAIMEDVKSGEAY